jgi:hypothetical protein
MTFPRLYIFAQVMVGYTTDKERMRELSHFRYTQQCMIPHANNGDDI